MMLEPITKEEQQIVDVIKSNKFHIVIFVSIGIPMKKVFLRSIL
jgi:hypothetical protein